MKDKNISWAEYDKRRAYRDLHWYPTQTKAWRERTALKKLFRFFI